MPEQPGDELDIQIVQEPTFTAPNRDAKWGDLNSINSELEKKQALYTWQNQGRVANSKNPEVWKAAFDAFQEVWLKKFKVGGVDVQPPYKVDLIFNFVGQGLNTGEAALYETNIYIVPLTDDVTLGELSNFSKEVKNTTIKKTKHLTYSELL